MLIATILLPFVRYICWAKIRLPPERRMPAYAIRLPLPGVVDAEHSLQAQDDRSPFILISAPVTTVIAPPKTSAPVDTATLEMIVAAVGGGE